MPKTKQFSDESALIAAIQQFSWRGYHGASMQNLVDGMGIGRSSIYAAFHSKRGLFISALNFYISSCQQRFAEWLDQTRSPRTVIMNVFASATDGSSNGSLIVNAAVEMAPNDHEIAQIVDTALCDIEQLFLS